MEENTIKELQQKARYLRFDASVSVMSFFKIHDLLTMLKGKIREAQDLIEDMMWTDNKSTKWDSSYRTLTNKTRFQSRNIRDQFYSLIGKTEDVINKVIYLKLLATNTFRLSWVVKSYFEHIIKALEFCGYMHHIPAIQTMDADAEELIADLGNWICR